MHILFYLYPLSVTYRSDRQDIDIKGAHIPKGTIAGIPIYAIHHNPEVWPQPDKFDPERFVHIPIIVSIVHLAFLC